MLVGRLREAAFPQMSSSPVVSVKFCKSGWVC